MKWAFIWEIIVVFLCSTAVFGSDLNRKLHGAPPDRHALYQKEKFTCLDGSSTIPSDDVNDDYCDCLDGSDEPGTESCSSIGTSRFYCHNEGLLSTSIPSSRVNDGICDCCDGSDEIDWSDLTSRKCSNTCDKQIQQAQTEAIDVFGVVDQGYHVYKERIKQAKDRKEREQRRNAKYSERVDMLEALLKKVEMFTDYEEEIEKEDSIVRSRTQAQHQSEEQANMEGECDAEKGQCKDNSNDILGQEIPDEELLTVEDDKEESANPKKKSVHEEALLQDVNLSNGLSISLADYMIQATESIRRKENPTIADMKRNGFMGPIINNGNEGLRDGLFYLLSGVGLVVSPLRGIWEAMKFCYLKVYLPEVVKESIDGVRIQLKAWMARQEIAIRTLSNGQVWNHYANIRWGFQSIWDGPIFIYRWFNPVIDTTFKRPEAESLRQIGSEIRSDMNKLNNRISESIAIDTVDYGPHLAYFPLKGSCFSSFVDKYKYNFCPFEHVKQDSTSLGNWGKWSLPSSNEINYSVMYYSGGLKCWNGPQRSTLIHLECDVQDRIKSIEETSICFYTITFGTPSACSKELWLKAKSAVDRWSRNSRDEL